MNTYTKLKVDTCADITILNDPRFSRTGWTPRTPTHSRPSPWTWDHALTTGVGEAYVTTRDGTEICIEQAHLCTAARENVLATRNIASNAIPDLQQGHLRVLDAYFCSIACCDVSLPNSCSAWPHVQEDSLECVGVLGVHPVLEDGSFRMVMSAQVSTFNLV